MAINEWWRDNDAERYWVEITDRDDLGVDLYTPTAGSGGLMTPGYELINFVQPGDVVFHWHKRMTGGPALAARSIATGVIQDTEIKWQAHGTYGRAAEAPPPRAAWRMQLVDYTPLDPVVTYDEVLALEPQIRRIKSDLDLAHTGSLYFPFAFSDKRPMRASQTYMAKFPRALAELLQIDEVGAELLPDNRRQRRQGDSDGSPHQGRVDDSRVRGAIERRAVDVAVAWYESNGYTVVDTGATESYDLEATKETFAVGSGGETEAGREVRRVEVKGTMGRGETFELTIGEVKHARQFSPIDLFVVNHIGVQRLPDGNARGFGGEARLWADWTPAEESLEAIRFRHATPLAGFIRPEFSADQQPH